LHFGQPQHVVAQRVHRLLDSRQALAHLLQLPGLHIAAIEPVREHSRERPADDDDDQPEDERLGDLEKHIALDRHGESPPASDWPPHREGVRILT
jgi:hypothetical protein